MHDAAATARKRKGYERAALPRPKVPGSRPGGPGLSDSCLQTCAVVSCAASLASPESGKLEELTPRDRLEYMNIR